MSACPYCSSSDLTRDGHDQRGRVIRACRACGRHATSDSTSLVAGHRFPRDIILLAVRYYLQLGAAAERIAGILADRGVDVSGRTILPMGPEVRGRSVRADPSVQEASEHDLAGG
jgi:transposase-like protein